LRDGHDSQGKSLENMTATSGCRLDPLPNHGVRTQNGIARKAAGTVSKKAFRGITPARLGHPPFLAQLGDTVDWRRERGEQGEEGG
jgi:hypothetical protein